MADALLNKLINEELSSNLLIKWLLKTVPENDGDFKNISAYNIGQIDFITYFLNFIHEEAPCKSSETPQKLSTPKRIDKVQIHNSNDKSKVFKANLFTSLPPAVQEHHPSFDAGLDKSVGKISTPKSTKTPGSNRSDGYFSPISPLYQNPNQGNVSSRDTTRSRGSSKSLDKHSFCLGDFLVTSSKTSSRKKKHVESIDVKKETSRRIKPTSICLKPANSGFQKTENSFNFQENVDEEPVKSATEQRNLLVEERTKILSRKDSIEKAGHPVLLKRHSSLSKSDIKPMLSLVTFRSNIAGVINIFKTILDQKLVLNITSEIYFLISLVLSKQVNGSPQNSRTSQVIEGDGGEDSSLGIAVLDSSSVLWKSGENSERPVKANLCNSEIFQTIHNVVFFAVKCLETQIKVIQFYDKTTIRLLAENERIKSFSPGLSRKLLHYANKKVEKPCIEIFTPISQTNVCFNIDTDNKENFPDMFSFHSFRKQRDLFYEILRVWETQHLVTNWNFAAGLGGKIRSLFNFHCGPTNYMHLARLFKNQLLSSCAKGPKEKGLSENNLPFLPSFAIDADKLNRLTNRLVTKQETNGINSLPAFSGYQEFFKDFIIVSSNHFFNKHLCDNLISEIVELNDTKFSATDLEEEGNEIDVNTRKLYVSCIQNLRILAKFLGFIESLPYRSDVPNIPKNILDAHIKIREQSMPSINIKSLLESSIDKHTVVFTIPWLTKYLAMLDYMTLRLPYYMSVHYMLFDLYQNYATTDKSQCNAAMVKFCLGWLFELPHFPDVEYFNFCSKLMDTRKIQVDLCQNGTKDTKHKHQYLDHMSIVNQSVLYLCCPFLEEIKRILSTNACGSNIAVKYITPVTAAESNSEMAKKKLDQQLEEAFFSGQPTSLRKTVEFVSERIASTAVKYVCHDLVPEARQKAIKDLKENLLKTDVAENYNSDDQRKIALKKQAAVLAQSHLTNLLQTCEHEIQKLSHRKIPPSVEGLLPINTLDETKNVCIEITNKMYLERVKQWINSHVNLLLFTKDFDHEIHKNLVNGRKSDKEKTNFVLPATGRNCGHNEGTLSGFHALNNIKEACCKVTENKAITSDYVLCVLQDSYKSLTQRNDVNETVCSLISMTAFDFCLLLVADFPSLLSQPNSDLLSHFLKIWSYQPKSNTMFRALFCPRNVRILQRACKRNDAWDLYAKVVSHLLDKKLVEQDDLESQCTGFYNRDWDEGTLDSFSLFLKKLVSYSNCDVANKVTFLLDFLSDFCSDM